MLLSSGSIAVPTHKVDSVSTGHGPLQAHKRRSGRYGSGRASKVSPGAACCTAAVTWLCKGWHADRSPRLCGSNHIKPSESCMAHMASSDLQCSTAWKIDPKSIWVWLPRRLERRDQVMMTGSFGVKEDARLGLAQPRHIV